MNIVIADPQARIRRGMRILFEQQPGWTVTGEAADSQSLLALLREGCPDLVLIDWDLPGLPAAALLCLLREKFPGAMRVTISGKQELRQAALDSGADDFASKSESPDRLLTRIRLLQTYRMAPR